MKALSENIIANLVQPNFIRDLLVRDLPKFGISVNQNKTVAKFVDAYSAAVVGLSTVNIIDSEGYPESEHFIIGALRMLDGANAALGSTDWVPGISDGITQNGELTITNNGTIEIKDMPLSVFQPGADDPDAGFLILDKPIIWKAQTSLVANLSFGTAPTTANQNARLELWGVKFI